MGIGFGEGLLIAAIAVLFFGGKKLPELGKALGQSVRNFKDGMNGSDEKKEKDQDNKNS